MAESRKIEITQELMDRVVSITPSRLPGGLAKDSVNENINEYHLDDGSSFFVCTTPDCDYANAGYWPVNAHRASHAKARTRTEKRVPDFDEAVAIIRNRIAEIAERDDLIRQQARTITELNSELEKYRRFTR